MRSPLSAVLCITLACLDPFCSLARAADPIISSPFPQGQPVISVDEANQRAAQQNDQPQEETTDLFFGSGPLSMATLSVSAQSVSSLQHYPGAKVVGYNTLGKSAPLIGYATVKGIDQNNFSYMYDLGAAKGAAVDIVIDKQGETFDFTAGFSIALRRDNQGSPTGGLPTLNLILEDTQGNTVERDIALSNTGVNPSFDFTGNNFDAAHVKKIVLRQRNQDLQSNRVAIDRRGEVFVTLGNVVAAYPLQGTPLPGGAALKPLNSVFGKLGGNQSGGRFPGYVRSFETTAGYGFAYDVGGSKDSFAKTVLSRTGGVFDLASHVKFGMKNSGNGAKALVRFTDSQGNTAEFMTGLTAAFLQYNFDLTDAYFQKGNFDRSHVAKVEVEVDRSLSPQRLGQIEFQIFQFETDPFERVKPDVTATPNIAGQAYIQTSPVSGAVIYQIQVASDANFTNVVHEGFPQGGNENVSLPAGAYFVRVRASENVQVETGPVTDWSNAVTVQVPADTFSGQKPSVTSADTSLAGVTTVQFGAVQGALLYRVDLATDTNFTQIVRTGFPSSPSEDFPRTVQGQADLTAGHYFARVQGMISGDANGPKTLFSDAFAFDIATPSLEAFKAVVSAPASQGNNQFQVTLQSLALALGYQVQVARDANFTDIVHDSSNATATRSFTLPEAGVFFLRARGSAGNPLSAGPFSQWSDVRTFDNPPAQYTGQKPAGLAAGQIPGNLVKIDFNAIPETAVYQVQVSRNASFTDILSEGFPGQNSETIPVPAAGTYYIRVRGSALASVEAGFVTQWSDTLVYDGDPITKAKPTIVTVNSNFAGEDSIFFTKVPGAATNQVQISKTPDFNELVYQGFAIDSPAVVNTLTELRSYFIRVRSIKFEPAAESPKSLWADTFTFDKVIGFQTLTPAAALTSADITVFPEGTAGPLGVTSVGPGNGATDHADALPRGVKVTYNTATQTFAGGGFSYDNFGSQPIESGDLRGLTEMVFGIKGSASQVKFEIVDAAGQSSFIRLSGIKSDVEQFWRIPFSVFSGVDFSKVRLIYFIVEGPGQAGTLEINRVRTGLDVNPTAGLHSSDVTELVSGSSTPFDVLVLDGVQDPFTGNVTAPSGLHYNYQTGSRGWAGAGFFYNLNPGVLPNDGHGNFVIGLKGTPSKVKVEFTDSANRKVSLPLTGITGAEQYWKIPLALLDALNLNQLKSVFFVVEGANQTGTLDILWIKRPLGIDPSATLTSADLTALPSGTIGAPRETAVSPANASSNAVKTDRGVQVTYNTGTDGWTGGGFTYDDFGTGPVESANWTGLTELRFGVQGDPSEVKLEILDTNGQKVQLRLQGIQKNNEKVWVVPASLLTGIDITKIRLIYFIVEGVGQTGVLNVNVLPPVFKLLPSANLTPDDINNPDVVEGQANLVTVHPTGASAAIDFLPDERGFHLDFSTSSAGWSGGGLDFDDGGTPAVETGDFHLLDQMIFGLKGSIPDVKLEIIDANGVHVNIPISGIDANTEKVWVLPFSPLLATLDLSKIRQIYFIVEGNSKTGSLDVTFDPPA
ncbi:MAG TPA: hypothetical protein VL688_02095 [Verrucomicrobiae bacterium]|nr:hypothetical protein [Verrucomicrobiae bacterium]